jgi:hypothetical protein
MGLFCLSHGILLQAPTTGLAFRSAAEESASLPSKHMQFADIAKISDIESDVVVLL